MPKVKATNEADIDAAMREIQAPDTIYEDPRYGGEMQEGEPVEITIEPKKKPAAKKAVKKPAAKKKAAPKKKPATKPKPAAKKPETVKEAVDTVVQDEARKQFETNCQVLFDAFVHAGFRGIKIEDLLNKPGLDKCGDVPTLLKMGAKTLKENMDRRALTVENGPADTLTNTGGRFSNIQFRWWKCPSCDGENKTQNDQNGNPQEQCYYCKAVFTDVDNFVIEKE